MRVVTDCTAYQDLIATRLVEPLSPADEAALAHHVQSCVSCQALQAELQETHDAVKSLRQQRPDPLVVQSVLASLKRKGVIGKPATPWWPAMRRRAGVVWAATGALAVFALVVWTAHKELRLTRSALTSQRGQSGATQSMPVEITVRLAKNQKGQEPALLAPGEFVEEDQDYSLDVMLNQPLHISVVSVSSDGNVSSIFHSDTSSRLSAAMDPGQHPFRIEVRALHPPGQSGEIQIWVAAADRALTTADAALCERFACLCAEEGTCATAPPSSLQAGVSMPAPDGKHELRQQAEIGKVALVHFPIRIK